MRQETLEQRSALAASTDAGDGSYTGITRTAIAVLVSATCLVTCWSYAIAAQKIVFDRACAAKDLEIVTQIELYGEAQEISPEILVDAFAAVAKARRTCAMGQVAAALDLYDSIGFGASHTAQVKQ
jgi:hypothetical protein